MTTLTLIETVLNVKPLQSVKSYSPAPVPAGSEIEAVMLSAAKQIRTTYASGKRYVEYNAKDPSDYFTACGETWSAVLEAEQQAQDELEAKLVNSVFEKTGWFQANLRPTRLQTQKEIAAIAVKAARHAKQFYAKQASLI